MKSTGKTASGTGVKSGLSKQEGFKAGPEQLGAMKGSDSNGRKGTADVGKKK